jgi:site-specific DNA recombinase
MVRAKPMVRSAAERRVGVYCRISLDRDGQSLAIERQEEACRALCAKEGWEVVGLYVDRNLSAFKKGVVRPEFDRLQADVKAGRINTVVIWKLDRLSRSVSDFSRFLEFVTEHGCALASVSDAIDTTTPMGKSMLQITSVMAELEAATTGYRVAEAERHRARQGLWHGGGFRAFGYTRNGEIVPDEAAELRAMADALHGGQSLWAVAADLNERGILTTAGNTWTSRTLSQTLLAPRLRGVRVHRGDTYEGQWEGVFTESEHQSLIALLSSGWSPENRKKAKYSHLLSGLMVCGRCGQRLRWHPGRAAKRNFPKYQCSNEPGSKDACGRLAVVEDRADEVITGMLFAHIRASADQVETLLDERSAQDLRDQVEEDRSAKEELSRDRYIRRCIDDATFLARQEELDQRITTGEVQLAHLTRRSSVDFGADLDTWWQEATIEDKRAVLRVFIDRIEVAPVGKGGRQFKPERLTVVWSA